MWLGNSPGVRGGGGGNRGRRQGITARMSLRAKTLGRGTELHGQMYTTVGFRA